LRQFFATETALLFNSGFDANVGFFSCIPQKGDVIVYEGYVHASVYDGMRASRIDRERLTPFAHNSVETLRLALTTVRNQIENRQSMFVAVESLYSMDRMFAPLTEMVEVIDNIFSDGNTYFIVNKAHSMGIHGPQGRSCVAMLWLENQVLARLHTFSKVLAASGAVIVTNTIVRDYLLNYAQPLIYTISPTHATIITADASFDMLIDGTASYLHLLSLVCLLI